MTTPTGTGRTLLVLDYPGRRADARVADLELEAAGWRVRYLLAAPLPREPTSVGYAARLRERLAPVDAAPTAILAYCSGAPIAADLAAALPSTAGPVPLVAFDGIQSPPAYIAAEFLGAARQVGGARAASAVHIAPDTFTAEGLHVRGRDCLQWMERTLVDMATTALREDGADDWEAARGATQICGVYLDWLCYLISGHNTAWPSWGGEVTHVASRRHPVGAGWPGAAATTVHRVDADAGDLLRRGDVRELVLALVETFAARPKGALR